MSTFRVNYSSSLAFVSRSGVAGAWSSALEYWERKDALLSAPEEVGLNTKVQTKFNNSLLVETMLIVVLHKK
eukprot:1147250-Pelagomonas_calceolata.AAC.4